ncbi:transcription antitermination factor NusB [Bosea sp. (in: a-proteobacteria)]|uniref:transcription antitermination factor NusB n=1 Tax=Bosea sp. (in: a-proteobacteria) TaxID=1871050 RepID=UPI00260AFB81|nr:transcription antitermination factor NusB [Bosea sp. (in: a-proteobacteria)]MCO5092846.1 transcription antitermination factor NusB [Bosea sp. (in: a-proteobacteria)]
MSRAELRRGARLSVVQALYEMEVGGRGVIETMAEFEAFWIGKEVEEIALPKVELAFFRDVLGGVVREQRLVDRTVDDLLARDWPLKRVEAVMRAILRAGAYELAFRKDVPARAVISEYVAVANAFYAGEEIGMVNAVLDRMARDFRADEFDTPAA